MLGLGAAAAWKGLGCSVNGFLAAVVLLAAPRLGWTKESRLTKLECSPSKLSTALCLALAPLYNINIE